MTKIDDHKILADRLAEMLKGQDEIKVNHNENGTLVIFDSVEFSYDKDGKSEGISVSFWSA